MFRRLFVVVTILATCLVAMPQAAHAQSWKNYRITNTWHCKPDASNTWMITITVCTVINGTLAQGVVIVSNNTEEWLSVQADVWAYSRGAEVDDSSDSCDWANLGLGSSACFGPTFSLPCTANVQGYAKVGYSYAWEDSPVDYREAYAATNQMCITT